MLEDVLVQYGGREVDALTMYRDIFSLGDGLIQKVGEPAGAFKANPIGYYRQNGRKKGHYRIFFEDTFEETLKELQEADFAIVNGITYFGRKNVQEHASKVHALILDLDGVTDKTLGTFLHGAFSDFDLYPLPNYIALSGHGVHLYYLLDEPVPLYPNIKIQLKAFKYAMIEKLWNEYTSRDRKKQFQGINQGFRPIGGKTKIDGVRVRAFLMNSHPHTLGSLGKYVPEESRVDEGKLFKESHMTLEQAKKAYPQWYEDRVVNKRPKKYWVVKRDLYEWWKGQIRAGATYHHRYFNVMCLAIYAVKCGVPYGELEADALSFVPYLNSINPEEPFTEQDVMSALECYDKRYCTFPITDIEKITGISIPRNKRNGRRQDVHLKIARATRDILHEDWREGNGRPSAEQKVRDYLMSYPFASKKDIRDNTGLSYPTIRKYYDQIIEEINRVPSLDDVLEENIEKWMQFLLENRDQEKDFT